MLWYSGIVFFFWFILGLLQCLYFLNCLRENQSPDSFQTVLFILRLCFTSTILPCDLPWNTLVMSGQVLVIAFWICWISHREEYVEKLILYLLLLLNHWIMVEIWPVKVCFLEVFLEDVNLTCLSNFPYSHESSVLYFGNRYFISFLNIIRIFMSTVSVLVRLSNSLDAYCFPLTFYMSILAGEVSIQENQ